MAAISLETGKTSRKNQTIGLSISVVFHVLIILGLIWVVLMPPDPPLSSGEIAGVEVTLGDPDAGGPDETPATESAEIAPVPPQPEETSEEAVLTGTEEDAPEIDTKEDNKKPVDKPNQVKKTTEPVKQQKVNENALFKGSRTNGDPSSQGRGDGDNDGNQGHPDGNQDSDILKGTPGNGGGGNGFGLKGRVIQSKPTLTLASKNPGKVVVTIYVDRNGHVTKAEPGARGTTTTDKALWDFARQSAMKYRYNTKPDAPDIQIGQIEFDFNFKD